MPMIGVRELRQQTSEVMRRIKEEQAEYIITYQGRPVAVLLPLDEQVVEQAILQLGRQESAQSLQNYQDVAEKVREQWLTTKPTQELLDEVRR